jgi:drug/metabolite transporter (DMT)-like permease
MLVADLLLVSIGVVWGFNFVVIKDAIGRVDPMLYIMLRYLVAAAIFAALVPRSVTQAKRSDWLMGGVLGAFYLTALVVQTIGLQYTTPGKSSFITGLNVAMVPFLYWIVAKRSPGWTQVVGALIATVGLGVLSLQGDFTLSWGDTLTLIGALFYALHIMSTGFFAPRVEPKSLAVTQILVAAALISLVTPFTTSVTFDLPWQVWAAVLWTALSGTIYAFFMQSWAQRYTTSTRAAVFLCLESVSGAVFGVMFGMDDLTWRLVGGAGLIFTGIIIIETLPSRAGRAEPVATGDALLPVADGGGAAPAKGGEDGPAERSGHEPADAAADGVGGEGEGDDDAERADPPPGTVD